MSSALYRRYRSTRFGELIGQDHIAATLQCEVRSGTIAHAYLFAGIRGTGKTSTARILARSVNCLEPGDGEPCNRCPACREVLSGAAVDVLEIDAASNRGIDDVRELRERVNYLPASLRRKVYIIDEAHMLTADAWNAFLKTLEEPPPHVLFVLATTEPHRVPETVRSRVQRFDFRRVEAAAIAAHLIDIATREGVALEAPAASLLARAGQGSVRDALSLLDQVLGGGDRPVTAASVRQALGLADPALVRDILTALGRGDGAAVLRSTARVFEAGAEAQQVVRELSRLARAAAFGGIGYPEGAALDAGDEDLCRSLAGGAPPRFWVDALELLGSTEMNLRQPVDGRLQLELCLLRLLHPISSPPPVAPSPGDLAERVAALERRAGVAPRPAGGTMSPAATSPATAATPAFPAESRPGSGAGAIASGSPPPGGPAEMPATAGGLERADLATWTAAWPRFLEAMNRRDFMLGGLLNSCRPVEASPGRLVIGAPYPFHLEQIRSGSKARLLAEVAAELAGRPTEVGTVLTGEEERRGGGADVAEASRAALEAFPGSRLVGSRTREPRGEESGGRDPS